MTPERPAELWRLDGTRTRSISAENPTGAPGGGARATTGTGAHAARLLGIGWKISPSILLADGETATLADISGPGVLRHCWLTTDRTALRAITLRMYWDEAAEPAIEAPLGDLFCNGWDELALIDSEMIVVAPAGGLNSYWPMPFRGHARITLENNCGRTVPVYYQITYSEEEVPADAGYLHARWSRSAPVGSPAIHTVLDTVPGPGRYVGTYQAIRPNAPRWWGEGEFKFYMDGDTEFPTLCGTGTEDYFGGAWNFDVNGAYQPYSTQYLGLPQVLPADEIYQPHQRYGMYRWHVRDPICFERDLRVTVQALGWRDSETYLPLEDAEIATTAWWYQAVPPG
ncbi:glycoside hydrolase family 172 protein [Nocardia suismassiliense]|uniref:glycoside hydrolase family 172 protein n=1 Tax=Nocardia suismassiliense TaxID=2077092 RepID=UPI000D1FAED3|nr:glycoside hydrolase family 172 protein [Nocardia suismassiliense]